MILLEGLSVLYFPFRVVSPTSTTPIRRRAWRLGRVGPRADSEAELSER
jgi:hypothetical protein